uniref:Uncharacterized protein n=2 Tax=Aegilops tauschii TaxID=37682 RepID=A0A453AYJ4_AEGTS
MRCAVGAGGVPIFSPTSQAQCRSAYVGVARHMADRRWSAATRKERLCCLNKDGKYNSIHKPTWITHIWTDGTWKIHQQQKQQFSKLRKSDIEAGDQLQDLCCLLTLLKVQFYLQVPTKRIGKEKSSPNFQNTLLQRSCPSKTPGASLTVISSNALIQAATRNIECLK